MVTYKFCLKCGNKIKFPDDIICPYCGFDEAKYMNSLSGVKTSFIPVNQKKFMFTNAEALAIGIYPQDEACKMAIMAQMYDEE